MNFWIFERYYIISRHLCEFNNQQDICQLKLAEAFQSQIIVWALKTLHKQLKSKFCTYERKGQKGMLKMFKMLKRKTLFLHFFT